MKVLKHSPWQSFAFAILLLFSFNSLADDGVILAASGDIFVNGSPAEQGDFVNSGDKLRAAFGAFMIVEMDDLSILNIRSNTEVDLTDYVYDVVDPTKNNQDVNIVDGTLRFTSGLIARNDNSDIAVRAGEVTLGVRGTTFGVTYNRRTGAVSVQVNQGFVISSLGGTTISSADGNAIAPGSAQTIAPNEDGTFTVLQTKNKNGILGRKSTKKIVYEVVEDKATGKKSLQVKSVETVDERLTNLAIAGYLDQNQRIQAMESEGYSTTRNDDGSITFTSEDGKKTIKDYWYESDNAKYIKALSSLRNDVLGDGENDGASSNILEFGGSTETTTRDTTSRDANAFNQAITNTDQ
ncbi:MAG: FecR domain-containing protein [Pseudomonadota bacterium]